MLLSLQERRIYAQPALNDKSTGLHALELFGPGGLAGIADVDHLGFRALVQVVSTEESLLGSVLDEHEVP